MRNLLILFVLFLTSSFIYGQNTTWVNGYYKSNGTYVQGHYKQTPNNTNHDNWSTKTQVNPFTSENGTRAKDYSPEAANYGSGKMIYTGPNGGKYYFNDKGNKVYVPK